MKSIAMLVLTGICLVTFAAPVLAPATRGKPPANANHSIGVIVDSVIVHEPTGDTLAADRSSNSVVRFERRLDPDAACTSDVGCDYGTSVPLIDSVFVEKAGLSVGTYEVRHYYQFDRGFWAIRCGTVVVSDNTRGVVLDCREHTVRK
ncbi:MAG: hypothetical protein F4Z31_17580 [Gemmatimonadetes bacterium]|nr:hypothetical protein [Gemmatimonadota bacterium]MYE93616.1 hypothetical protein [Gemmatimonadota bacterium]MYJ09383.1 hypothetical protein [Gemmatimonadota bacterium]